MSRRWLAALFTLALAAGATGACQNATDLKTGDCFNGGSGEEVTTVTPVDCAQAHEKEVYASFTHPGAGGPYPGDTVLGEYADRVCTEAFADFVGRSFESSELYFSSLTPSSGSWADGDHLISCMVHQENNVPLTGSMQGSRR
jgi:hypothetical protein